MLALTASELRQWRAASRYWELVASNHHATAVWLEEHLRLREIATLDASRRWLLTTLRYRTVVDRLDGGP